MVDIVSPAKRSEMMSGIRNKDTKPEIVIRKSLHARGFRYRLHDRKIPGKPDIVFPKYNAVIFVHGCFWHGHDCHLFRLPATRALWWRTKIEANQERDLRNDKLVRQQGWRQAKVWECAIKGKSSLGLEVVVSKLDSWLRSMEEQLEIYGES